MQTPLVSPSARRPPPSQPIVRRDTMDDQVSLTSSIPTYLECLIHRKTSILGRPFKNSKFCDCCGMRYQKQVLDVLFEPKNTYYLGSGLASYFMFIKFCVVVALCCTLLFSLTNIATNLLGKQCESSNNVVSCVSTRYIDLSVANKIGDQSWVQLQSYLAIAAIAFMIGIFQYSRKAFAELEIEANSLPNESDYAVIFRLKLDEYTEEDIVEGIQQWWERHKRRPILHPNLNYEEFPVEKVIFSYKVSQYNTLESQRQQIKKEQLKYRRKFRTGQKKAELNEQQQKLEQIEQTIQTRRLPKNNKCIVLFRYPEQKQYILEQHQRTLLNIIFRCCYNFVRVKGKSVSIKHAALPSEINWHNHEVESRRKHILRFVVKVGCLLLIAVAEGVIFGLLYLTFKKSQTGIQQLDEYISPVLSLAIGLINLALYKVLTLISRYEYRATTLEDKVSVTSKVVISIFLNSGIMLLFAYFILDLKSVWVANGFIDTMTFSYLLVTFMPHVLAYLNFDVIVKAFQRLKLRCSSRKLQDTPQAVANRIHERPQAEIYEKYAWMINLMWWSSVFAPIIPISYPCALASLLIHFWSEKLMYVGIIRQPKPFGSYLNKEMLGIVEATPFFLAAGNIGLNLILLDIKKQPIELSVLLVDIIAVGISLILFIVPSAARNKLIEKIFCIKPDENRLGQSYQDAHNRFITTYEKENPVYRELEINKLQNDRKKRMDATKVSRLEPGQSSRQEEMALPPPFPPTLRL